tara:strand:+ start:1029 stop:1385 length:357 start_codon:yes stop_codon:yes gene_type:complete
MMSEREKSAIAPMEKRGVKVRARCTDEKKAFSTASTDHLEHTCTPKRSALVSAESRSTLGGGGGEGGGNDGDSGGDDGVVASVAFSSGVGTVDAPVVAAVTAAAAVGGARTYSGSEAR